MAADHTFPAFDPATLARAQERADQEGLSLDAWLDRMVELNEVVEEADGDELLIAPLRRTDEPDTWAGRAILDKREHGRHRRFFILGTTDKTEGEATKSASWGVVHVHGPLIHEPDTAGGRIALVDTRQIGFAQHALSRGLTAVRGIAGPLRPSPVSASDAVFRFKACVDQAALLMGQAFAECAVADFEPVRPRRSFKKSPAPALWYLTAVEEGLAQSRTVCRALKHRWTPTPEAEQLFDAAFVVLSDLTPSRTDLLRLRQSDRTRAAEVLSRHLELAAEQVEMSAQLSAEVEAPAAAPPSNEERFADLRSALLGRAGGGLTLTEASELLGVTRQALHKRVKTGSVLGMMDGAKLVLPVAQFEGGAVIPSLSTVLPVFDRAGPWSALQFLTEPDPNLGATPLQALREGRADETLHAARVYVGDVET